MSLRMQVLLLRFLDTGEIQPVGSEQLERRLDVRIIAATNRDVDARVASGEFRQDLYFRLNVFPIQVPPLRARLEDVPALFEHYLQSYTQRRGVPVPRLEAGVLERLQKYDWPGNVRELQNMVERVVLRLDGDSVALDDLPAPLGPTAIRLHRPWRRGRDAAPWSASCSRGWWRTGSASGRSCTSPTWSAS